jgi:type II secretory pathway pseudopilin PulG
MPADRTVAARRAQLRAHATACLRAQAGDTMVEVLVAAVLVALIAVATFTGFSSVAHVASGQNTRAQASAIAEAEQARLHGLTLNNLSSSGSGSGNTTFNQQAGGTTYTITSSTKFVSGNGAASCTTSGTTTADEVQTTTQVSWSSDAFAGGPVVLHGLVTPPQGGSLIVRVLDAGGNAISGVSVSVSGPTSVTPLTTDSSGCVEFGGLSGGSYTAAGTINSQNTTGSATVVATQTKTIVLTPTGGTGGISATFTTTYNGSSHASSADQVTAWNPSNPTVYNVFGTASTLGNNTYHSTVSSGGQFAPGNYTTYAGTCSGDYSASGYAVAAVTAGTTQPVSLPQPAMIVDVWGGASAPTEIDDTAAQLTYSGTWTHATGYGNDYDGTESWSNTTGNYVSLTFTGTSVEWITSLVSNHGMANIFIDGNQVAANVDTYAATTVNQYVAFSAAGLSAGSHTLKVVVAGTKNPNASNDFVTTDAVIVGSDSGTQVDDPPSSSVSYSGSHWTHASTGNSNYGSTESYDLTAGDYVQFTFTGTSVEWLAPVSSNSGYADIYIDGTKVASNITTYSPTTIYQQVIWSTAGLSNTSHTLKIMVDGTEPPGSTSTYVQVDSFIYGSPGGLLNVAPIVTLTDNNAGCSSKNYPATQVPTSTQGALADPGQPYGNWTVCASSGGVKNTATVTNTSYTAGNVVNVYLNAGAAGLTGGSCT